MVERTRAIPRLPIGGVRNGSLAATACPRSWRRRRLSPARTPTRGRARDRTGVSRRLSGCALMAHQRRGEAILLSARQAAAPATSFTLPTGPTAPSQSGQANGSGRGGAEEAPRVGGLLARRTEARCRLLRLHAGLQTSAQAVVGGHQNWPQDQTRRVNISGQPVRASTYTHVFFGGGKGDGGVIATADQKSTQRKSDP
ncbi:MAG: hypothetical protein JWL77_7144 [Chthonomonadaceae bacterium]|nr:hypothetical protein [Chthonomonadaceae bacterium]